MQLHDTIVAVSSPPGTAARGIVRLSGPDAHRFAAAVFDVLQGDGAPSKYPVVTDGRIRLESGSLPASAWLFAAPKSYSRQDMVELHVLGSSGVLGLIVETLIAAGARRAEAGEFTARAYLNGALDLAQVHGVAALISAQSDGQRRAAARLLEGSLSKTAHAAREELADLLALVEGALDFADEPIEFITPVDLRDRLAGLAASLQETLDASMRTERWGRMPHVLLAGLPNAGKSSLLNRLSGLDRAIATPTAGTTRDTLTTSLRIGDIECVLVDSAGINASVPRAACLPVRMPEKGHIVDRLATEATRTSAHDADFLVWVIDASETSASWPSQLRVLQSVWPRLPDGILAALNKVDIASAEEILTWSAGISGSGLDAPVQISAKTGAGSSDLRRRLETYLHASAGREHDSPLALAGEHHDALQRAVQALDRAIKLALADADTLADADLVALELHAAADALGVLVGKDVPDDLLGRVFARFCVGK